MSKTKIEWCDISINPVKGLCPVACDYCYARRMYKRFKWDGTIRFDDQVLFGLPKEPKRIFVGSTMELFGKWVKPNWMEFILQTANLYPQHTFIFLTKKPVGLRKWSPFPNNCWVGVSTTGCDNNSYLEDNFRDIRATVKFISIEPMLDYTPLDLRWVNWVIIGQQTPTNKKTEPNPHWIKDIADDCYKLKIPLFLKDNLEPLLVQEKDGNRYAPLWANGGNGTLKQEFPK
jgi:protein gp37